MPHTRHPRRDNDDQPHSADADQSEPAQPASDAPGRVPHTRTGTAWAALIVAAVLAVLLIVFLVQNTHTTEISFLWMSADTPVAIALLIAAVGSVVLTLVLGTARITQLRRVIRKQRT